jgi:hypothetical protein
MRSRPASLLSRPDVVSEAIAQQGFPMGSPGAGRAGRGAGATNPQRRAIDDAGFLSNGGLHSSGCFHVSFTPEPSGVVWTGTGAVTRG